MLVALPTHCMARDSGAFHAKKSRPMHGSDNIIVYSLRPWQADEPARHVNSC